jgi:Transcriptional regulatory protein, C terminal
MEIVCRKLFKLTNLEAGFIVLLLKVEHVTKAQLHHVIETQRLQRPSRPDNMEMTDEKMVDVMICKLRKKLKLIDPKFLITTLWGGGYFIEVPAKEKFYAKLAAEGVTPDGTSEPASAVHAGYSRSDGDECGHITQ